MNSKNNQPIPSVEDQKYSDRWEMHETDREYRMFLKDWDFNSYIEHCKDSYNKLCAETALKSLKTSTEVLEEIKEQYDHLGQKLPYTNINDWYRANHGKR